MDLRRGGSCGVLLQCIGVWVRAPHAPFLFGLSLLLVLNQRADIAIPPWYGADAGRKERKGKERKEHEERTEEKKEGKQEG